MRNDEVKLGNRKGTASIRKILYILNHLDDDDIDWMVDAVPGAPDYLHSRRIFEDLRCD